MAIDYEGLIIDRPLKAIFSDRENNILCVLDNFSNLSLNTSAETKDKTNADGTLLKRFYTSKSLEISGESAVFSFDMAGMQFGDGIQRASEDNKIQMHKILQFTKADTVTLPDTPVEGTIVVYGCKTSGTPDLTKRYTADTAAGAGKFAISGTTLSLPTDATDLVQVVYEYEAAGGVKVVNRADKFPETCQALFQVLVAESKDCTDTLRLAYIYVPRFQMAPDFEWTFDTESTHAFSGAAQSDVCSPTKQLCYVTLSDNDIQE